jgi:AraC family transcriptional regulator
VAEPIPTSKHRKQGDVATTRLVHVSEYSCPCDKGAPVAVEQFSQPTISIVRSGAFGFRSDRDDQQLAPGFLLLANPGQRYEISHEHRGADRCVIFRFDEAALEEIGGSDARSGVRRYFSRSVLPPIPRVDALSQLVDQCSTPEGVDEVGLALAACVLAHTAARPHRVAPPLRQTRRTRDRIFAALEHIERTSEEALSLSLLADVVGLSPYHFLRLFKRETGVTPYRFLMHARVRKAVALLRDTSRPVTEVAFAVGFGDLSNFINFFRREVGCSPSRFRTAEPKNCATTMSASLLGPVRARC